MTSLFKSKKGNVTDIMIIGIFIAVLAIVLVVLTFAFDLIAVDLEADFTERNETQALDIIQTTNTDYPSLWDGAIIMLFLGLWMATLISSFFLDSHPVFFMIGVFVLIPMMIVMVYINNFYIETMEITQFITYQTKFPMTYFLGTNIFIVMIIVAGSILAALYAKSKI